jgi:hypothetical protein
VCDLENLKNEEAMTGVGSQRHSKKRGERERDREREREREELFSMYRYLLSATKFLPKSGISYVY